VRILKDLSESVYGRDVLIVEDIIDTGLTLSYILRNLKERGPRQLKVCTLLDRTVRRIAPLSIDYSGFEVGEEYLVGYGLDHLQRWRNLRFICSITGDAPGN
jgi:hypoxanthine phosphoribosyltransferase